MPLIGAAAATVLVLIAVLLTPPPGADAASGLAGLARLAVYALAALTLVATAAPPRLQHASQTAPAGARAYTVLGLGLLASVAIAFVEVVRLRRNLADGIGPALWILSMLVLLVYSVLPPVRRIGRPATFTPVRGRVWLLAIGLVVLAAALRLPDLGALPMGINADEGDRAATAFDVLSGAAPPSSFDSGWFYINMVYFRLLALDMSTFGADVAGGRVLNALCGTGFTAAVAWYGVREFGARTGLFATALAATAGISLQHGRMIVETGPTILLWAVSLGAFLYAAHTIRPWAFVVAGLSGGLSVYFYPSARLWVVGAGLTLAVLWAFSRRDQWANLALGSLLAAVASIVAVTPFLVHLETHQIEAANRFVQTNVFDPANQRRLSYVTAPEAVPRLLALQTERTLGMFDRYPDGGGFYPIQRPMFPRPLAALTLVAVFWVLLSAWRDPRLAIVSIWFWVGLSGVLVTVETPDVLRSAGMLPAFCVIVPLLLVEAVDRLVPLVYTRDRALFASLAPALLALVIGTTEAGAYVQYFRALAPSWGPSTREGWTVARFGEIGPVYSMELNEHLVSSGWVRLLAPRAERGRLPNPGRELPAIAPAIDVADAERRPQVLPIANQGLTFLLAPNENQLAYRDLIAGLYPGVREEVDSDGRVGLVLSSDVVAATRGVKLTDQNGQVMRIDGFGEVPSSLMLPQRLTWRAGVLLPRSGQYSFEILSAEAAQLALDGVTVLDGTQRRAATVLAARGLHFVELSGMVDGPGRAIVLRESGRELTAAQTYPLMDAPWGLLARWGGAGTQTDSPADAVLDTTVAMAFFDPELALPSLPATLTWSGSLVAPRSGVFRMGLAAEDDMRLELDGRPIPVVRTTPDDWARVGFGTPVRLTAGVHDVKLSLDVTHGGRELARWNWVLPNGDGSIDPRGEWSVVPPQVLRPASPVRVL